MTRTEYLLTCLAEEAAEVTQEASKCLRFGATEVYAPIGFSNAERLRREINDLCAIIYLLQSEGIFDPEKSLLNDTNWIRQKIEKTEAMIIYSRDLGRVQ